MQYRKSALAAFLSLFILFSISLFLYSCGVSSPTSSTGAATPVTGISAFGTNGIYNIYVANSNSPVGANVGIIDPNTGKSTTAQGGSYPVSIAINPVLNKFYVVNAFSNNISVFDATTNALITNIALPANSFPDNLAINPNTNKIYVTDPNGGGINVIDPISNIVIKKITTSLTLPRGIAIDTITNKAYVTHQYDSRVFVIDTNTDTLLTPINIAFNTRPLGIAVDSGANRAYVAYSNTDQIAIINTASNSVIGNIPIVKGKATRGGITAATPIAIALYPFAKKAYVANKFSDTVSVIDLITNTEIKAIPVGSISGAVTENSSNMIVIDPTINKVYVANINSNNITVIDTTTDTVVNTIPTGVSPNGLALALPFNTTPVTPPIVTPPPPPPNVTLTSITINPPAYTLPVASDAVFKATANYSDGSAQNITNTAAWSLPTVVSNGVPVPIASILNGVLVGLNAGSGTVTVPYGGKTGTATLTVTPEVPTNVIITPLAATITQGQTQQFIATAIYTGGRSLDITNDPNTKWISGAPSVAMIDPLTGIATGKSQGTSNIAVSYNNKTYPFVVLTVTPPIMTINITYTPTNPQVSDIVKMSAVGTYSDPNIPSVNLDKLASFWSNNMSIAALSNTSFPFLVSPEFQAMAAGTTNITAKWTTPYGQLASGTVAITVGGTGNMCNKQYISYSMNNYPSTAYDTYFYPDGVTPHTIGTNSTGTTQNPPIYGKGCAVTAYAMVFATLGLKINGQLVNPVNLNQWLITNGGYSSGGYIDPAIIKAFPGAPSTVLTTTDKVYLDNAIKTCKPIIAGVTTHLGNPHYVVVTGKNGNDYVIIDPYSYRTTSLKDYYGNNINQVIIF